MSDPNNPRLSAVRLLDTELYRLRVGLRPKPLPNPSADTSRRVKYSPRRQVVSRICPHMRHSWFAHASRPAPAPEGLAVEARKTLSELLQGVVPRAPRPKKLEKPLKQPPPACTPSVQHLLQSYSPANVEYCFRPQELALPHDEQSRNRRQVLKLFDDAVRDANPLAQGAGPEGPSPSFEFFPRLPPELRLVIWKYALTLRGARTLSAEYKGYGMTRAWNSRLAMPPMARVNREAREVALTAVPVTERPDNGDDVLRAWALPGDTLEVTSGMNEFLVADQFGQDMPGFTRLATCFGQFLACPEQFRSRTRRISVCFRQARMILVVVQTIHININTDNRAAQLAEDLALDRDEPFISTDVEPDSSSAATGLRVYDTGLIEQPGAIRISTVVALSDRARIEELLAIGTAVGQFEDGLYSRLLALESHSNAYCLDDCLQRWWLTHGLPVVQAAFDDGTRGSRLPDIAPAIRFRFQWSQDWES